MSGENTSAIYTVWETLTRLAGEVSYPATSPAGLNPDGVKVWFGDYAMPAYGQELSVERVVVAPIVTAPDEEWGPIGRWSREERFACYLYVVTAIPGRSETQARDRLEALTAPLQRKLRDVMALRTTGGHPAEFDPYPHWQIACRRLTPLVAPSPDGAVGTAELEVLCEFRVNTPPVT